MPSRGFYKCWVVTEATAATAAAAATALRPIALVSAASWV